MAYKNNIPQPSNQISDSQADLLGNFAAIGTILNPDGKYVNLATTSAPLIAAGNIGLYSKVNGGSSLNELYFKRDSGSGVDGVPITAKKITAGEGWAYLPSGMIIQWGAGSAPYAGPGTPKNFPMAFPTACLSIVGSVRGGISSNTYSKNVNFAVNDRTKFTPVGTRSDGVLGSLTYNYMAIGY